LCSLVLDVLHAAGYNLPGACFLQAYCTHPSIDLLSPVFQRAFPPRGGVKHARDPLPVEDKDAVAVPVGDDDTPRARQPVRDYSCAARDKVLGQSHVTFDFELAIKDADSIHSGVCEDDATHCVDSHVRLHGHR
jgi:hypothetical protein